MASVSEAIIMFEYQFILKISEFSKSWVFNILLRKVIHSVILAC